MQKVWFIKLIFLIGVLLILQPARAQLYIGFGGGIDNNMLSTNISNLAFTAYRPKTGLILDIPVQVRLGTWLALSTGISLLQKKYEWYRTGFYQGEYEEFINTYLQVPLALQASFGGTNVRGFVEGGAYIGFWTGGRVRGILPNEMNPIYPSSPLPHSSFLQIDSAYSFNQTYTFNNRRDNRVALGVFGGAGIEYLPPRRKHPNQLSSWRFYAKAQFYNDLTDQQKQYMFGQTPRYNLTELLTAGIMRRL